MELARRLLFRTGCDLNTFDVFMPQFLHKMPGYEKPISLTVGDNILESVFEDRFCRMHLAIASVTHLPIIITKIIIAHHILCMMEAGIFVLKEDIERRPDVVSERANICICNRKSFDVDGGFPYIIARCIATGPGWVADH
jgi:hypothetical protein